MRFLGIVALKVPNVINTGANFAEDMAFYLLIGCIRFARYLGAAAILVPYGQLYRVASDPSPGLD